MLTAGCSQEQVAQLESEEAMLAAQVETEKERVAAATKVGLPILMNPDPRTLNPPPTRLELPA